VTESASGICRAQSFRLGVCCQRVWAWSSPRWPWAF
jgi:hypothetical protein